MPLAVPVLLVLVVLPAFIFGIVWLRIRVKEKLKEKYYWDMVKDLREAGIEPVDYGIFRGGKIDISLNPLFARGFTVRVAAWSTTIHDQELQRGKPVPPEFEKFKPLLARWPTAGKMVTECYAAGVTDDPKLSSTFKELLELSKVPLSKPCRGGTFTYREGFEQTVPQWHWRHDQRPKLPKDVQRYCFSYWNDSPLLNPILMRVLWELSADSRRFFISSTEDLRFLEHGFSRQDIACWGALLELKDPAMPVAADLLTDGEFFGGLLAARDLPAGFESEDMPKVRFHDAAINVFRKCDFYARRLYDDENSWFSGEYEIVSTRPLDVRGTLSRIATEIGAQVMDIDRRFNKRIVVPLNY